MRTFDGFNSTNGEICPVCKTQKDGICEAKQVHKKCYDLMIEMSDA